MQPHADEADEPVSSQVAKTDEPFPPQVFGGGPIEFSHLPLYPDHTAIHIWDGEVKLVGYILFKLRLLSYYKFLTLIYFYAGH